MFGIHCGRVDRNNQNIKLGTDLSYMGGSLYRQSGNGTGGLELGLDDDSEQAWILKPDKITRSIQVKVQSQEGDHRCNTGKKAGLAVLNLTLRENEAL